MYRKLRRQDREISDVEAVISILKETDFGFLATVNDDGCPYVIPLNHAYVDGHIIVHGAEEGQKLDNILRNPKVCYCVCTDYFFSADGPVMRYKSVVVHGEAEVVVEPKLRHSLIMAFSERFMPGQDLHCTDDEYQRAAIIRIKISHITGKENLGKGAENQ